MRVVLLGADEAARWLEGFVDVYRAAFSGPPYDRAEHEVGEFARALPAHVGRAGFRSVAAANDDGEVTGFAYGYYSVPGQWWYDNVSAALGREAAREWLNDAFQLAEIAVSPRWQGQGLGRQLHDGLLADAPSARGVLSTLDAPTVAFAMYERRGWQPLLTGFRFPGVARPYTIMGRLLPGSGAVGLEREGAK